jgi:predicted CXXCH cytochrome family protein
MLNPFVRAALFITLFSFLLPWAAADPQQQNDGARYAGAETCQACHDELHAALQKTAHERLLRNARADQNGCEACHGPGQDHVDNNGDRNKIVTYTDMPKKVVRQRCRLCHEVSADKPHVAQGVGCLDCHSMHHFQENKALLVLPGTRLCQKCHGD